MNARRLLAVAILTLLAAGGCASGGGQSPGAEPTSDVTATAGAGAPTTTPAPTPGAGEDWTSDPLTVRHDVPVPPVPVIVTIRSAAHPGYDRVVFDISGALPGYDVRYVDTPVEDATGRAADVPGRRFLQIRFEPAQAHDDSGNALTPRARTLNYPMLEAYAITGDFEGVVTVVLGLDDVVGFRVGELPGRVYVDVAA